MEDIKAIIRELLKYDGEILDLLINSDYEDNKEYIFDANEAYELLVTFSNSSL